mmetsp:Transcript_2157/g.3117  ORF Transcript_2157/g.3117 Transcript_2157/m.3117 type:complete len:533 (+) Transcript_2157:40-1638(+)
MGNACVSKVIDLFVFTPPKPCSYDTEMKDAKENGKLPEGIVFINTKHGSKIPLHIVKHKRARCTVLYSHGNSEDLGPMIANQYLSDWFRGNYVSYDYTGYGYAEGGVHTEEHVYNDIEAVYDYLINEAGIKPDQLILYGRSLGSGPTIHLASTKPKGIAGMVLESAILSIVRTQCRCVSSTWGSDIFANIDKIDKIECSTLIIHGTRDCIVPHYHGRYLQDNIKNTVEPMWLPRGHNDIWEGDEAYCRPIFYKINKFISHALRQRRKESLRAAVHPSKYMKRRESVETKASIGTKTSDINDAKTLLLKPNLDDRPLPATPEIFAKRTINLDDIELNPINNEARKSELKNIEISGLNSEFRKTGLKDSEITVRTSESRQVDVKGMTLKSESESKNEKSMDKTGTTFITEENGGKSDFEQESSAPIVKQPDGVDENMVVDQREKLGNVDKKVDEKVDENRKLDLDEKVKDRDGEMNIEDEVEEKVKKLDDGDDKIDDGNGKVEDENENSEGDKLVDEVKTINKGQKVGKKIIQN